MPSRFSHVCLFVTPWIVAHQSFLSVGFSRQKYWSGCHALLQGIFPIPEWNPCLLPLLHWPAGSLPLMPPGKPLSTVTWFNLCFKNQSTDYCVDKGSEQTKVELGRAMSTLGFPGSSMVKIPPAMQEPQEKQIQSLGEEDPLEKEMASHSSVLTWRIPMERGAWRTTVHGAVKRWT